MVCAGLATSFRNRVLWGSPSHPIAKGGPFRMSDLLHTHARPPRAEAFPLDMIAERMMSPAANGSYRFLEICGKEEELTFRCYSRAERTHVGVIQYLYIC